jgi:hypothetical protein
MYIFIISRSTALRMRRILENFRENKNTHYMLNDLFFPENRAVYEIMWKIIAEPDRPQMTI